MKNFILILFLSSIFSLNIQAQRGWEAGGLVGVSHYFGDLNTNFRISDPGLALGVFGRYNFNNRVAIKLGANYAQIAASDADSDNSFEQARNLSFRSTIIDGLAQFEFNFLPYNHGSRDEFFTPYLFAGLNVFKFNPQAEYNDEWIDLSPLGTEGQFRGVEYYTTTAGIVYGGGLKISFSYEWSIEFELSARRLFTDYLDDVSTTYADLDDLESLRGPLAVALADRSVELVPGDLDRPIGDTGRQRGNSNDNDMYVIFGASVVYYFGGINCPRISY